MSTTLVNSLLSDSINVNNRGLAFGDGLFETIKISAGKAEYLKLHLLRLQHGCEQLKIRCDMTAIKQDVAQVLSEAAVSEGILKITVSRAYSGRGYQASVGSGSDRIVTVTPARLDYHRQQKDGVSVRLCDIRLGINPALAKIKHLARLENVLARAEWTDDTIAEGILLDTDGRVVEGTMSNVFIVSAGQLITPSLHRCGVEGIIRQVILSNVSKTMGVFAREQDVTVNDLIKADEVFLCNSLIGLWPVKKIGCHKKNIGSMSLKLQRALQSDVLK